ncbi:MAG: pilus assembly protein [Planctomycetaceae bacterium]|nr:pilus assembly protein [Planctomycetaceae bacterium]
MQRHHTTTRHSEQPRRGAALVETAVCLPVLLLLTFGAIEASNAIVLKQTLTEISYETARFVTSQGSTKADALQRADEIIAARGLQNVTVDISPDVTVNTPPGTPITVTVSAAAASNSIGPQWYFKDATMAAQAVMVRL